MNRKEVALSQLIAIRRQFMEVLRKDMMTLAHLTDEARKKWIMEKGLEEACLDELRSQEGTVAHLLPARMLAWRRYWEYLQERTSASNEDLQKVSTELSRAQSAFEAAYAEVRKLERLSDRRLHVQEQEARRVGYRMADDLEIARDPQYRREHGTG